MELEARGDEGRRGEVGVREKMGTPRRSVGLFMGEEAREGRAEDSCWESSREMVSFMKGFSRDPPSALSSGMAIRREGEPGGRSVEARRGEEGPGGTSVEARRGEGELGEGVPF
jgi:hypothetical protein